jgi:hypothetical protein
MEGLIGSFHPVAAIAATGACDDCAYIRVLTQP